MWFLNTRLWIENFNRKEIRSDAIKTIKNFNTPSHLIRRTSILVTSATYFQKFKSPLKGTRYQTVDDVKTKKADFLEELTESNEGSYLEGDKRLIVKIKPLLSRSHYFCVTPRTSSTIT